MITILILLDQLTKWYVASNMLKFKIIDGFFEIAYVKNTGTIYGLFENNNLVFIVLGILICAIVIWCIKSSKALQSPQAKGFALILAGGISNLIDRIFRGYVVDFIWVKYIGGIFNLADSFIVIGIILIVIFEIRSFIKNG